MVQFAPERTEDSEYYAGDLSPFEAAAALGAQRDFWEFRKLMHPTMLKGWWQRDAARHLQQFYEDMVAGKRPALVMMAPPQHGKTETVTDFTAWVAGQNPNLKTIFGSYSDDLGVRVNLQLQRMMESYQYRLAFPNTRLNTKNTSTDSARWIRNSSLLEYVGNNGSFRNTTVMGAINGMGLDFGVIDDPMKGRAEAMSKTIRDKTWAWLTDDFFGRFSDKAGLLMIMTRWHLDDPLGRWIEMFPKTKILRYPAVAEVDEEYRKKGGALFPKLKPIEFLRERQKILTQSGWLSIYQQSPINAGGDMFPTERFNIIASVDRREIKRSVRYVDKASSDGDGDYTCASLVHEMKNGTTIVEDVIRGQWSALERDDRIMQAAVADRALCPRYEIWFEQEPGSGGKESAEASARKFKGFTVKLDKVTGSKEVRAEPYAAQVQAGQVSIKAAGWNRAFLTEHEEFPNGRNDDQVDATAGAFNKLASSVGSYDRTLSWV